MPPLTAAEQALLDQHALAVQRAELDFDAEVAADPLLAPFVPLVQEAEAADIGDGQALPPGLHALIQREELVALWVATLGLNRESTRDHAPVLGQASGAPGTVNRGELVAQVDVDAAQQAPHTAPAWALIEARRLQIAGQPNAADQAIRQYLARAAESGRLSVRARRLFFRWYALVERHPAPKHPLPERRSGCGFSLDGFVEHILLFFAHDAEATLAWFLASDDAELGPGQLCGRQGADPDEDEPGESTASAQPRSAERLRLCVELTQQLRRQAPFQIDIMQGEEEAKGSEGWMEGCTKRLERAAAAPDWRVQVDRLALSGCPLVPAAGG